MKLLPFFPLPLKAVNKPPNCVSEWKTTNLHSGEYNGEFVGSFC